MVVATLHLGRSGFGRWGGRVTSVISSTAPQPVLFFALPDMLFRHHWPQTLFDDLRIVLAVAGRGPIISAMQEIANDWAAVEGSFEIGMNRARCRCLDGLLEIAQPDGTAFNQLSTDERGRATLGKARQGANPSGCGSG